MSTTQRELCRFGLQNTETTDASEQTPVTTLLKGLVSELDHPLCSFALIKPFQSFLIAQSIFM